MSNQIAEQVAYLIKQGLTQQEIAAAVDASQATVSRWANGKHADTKATTAKRLSDLVARVRRRKPGAQAAA